MQKNDIHYSVMIVSLSEQFDMVVKNALRSKVSSGSLTTVDTFKNVALARRKLLEKDYDIVIINTPLQDESGVEFALDISEMGNYGVLVVTPQEIYDYVFEQVTEYGIFVATKPMSNERVSQTLGQLLAVWKKIKEVEKKVEVLNDRLEELRIISKAKIVLVEKEKMTEDEAHRFIGKKAMDTGLSRKKVAMMILEDY